MNINVLTEEQCSSLLKQIEEAQNIVICCHKSPDGDALGSSLAWAYYLRTQQKQPTIIIPDAYPDFLHWLPGSETILRYDKHKEQGEELMRKADLVFCLDFNSYGRVDAMEQALRESPARRIMIDHHLDPQIDTSLTISMPESSSTSELVFRIVWQLGHFELMDKKWATCVYCGMMTDTGGFTYNSNDPAIYFIISQLLTKGINKDKIYRNVFNTLSAWAVRLRGYVLCHKLNVLSDLHASYFSLSKKEMRDFHFIKGDAEGLVNDPLRIKGMRLSISLREDDRHDNLIWVSLRSVDDFPCNEMAAQFFNGGGHLNASGGRLNCTLREAENTVKEAIRQFADRL